MYLGLTVRPNLFQGSWHGKSWIMCISRALDLHTSEHIQVSWWRYWVKLKGLSCSSKTLHKWQVQRKWHKWEFLYQRQKRFFLLWEWLSRSTGGCLGGCRVSILRDTPKPSGHGHLALGGPTWGEVGPGELPQSLPASAICDSANYFITLMTVAHHPENTAGRPRQGWEHTAFTLFNTLRNQRNPGIFDHSIY